MQPQTGVVGATGFVGSAVMRALRASGDDPISLVPRARDQDLADDSNAKQGSGTEKVDQIFRRLNFLDRKSVV